MNYHFYRYRVSFTLFCICIIFIVFTTSPHSKVLFLFTYGQQLQFQSQAEGVKNITYTDANGNYTLQYPLSWKVEYKEPFIKFGYPVTQFTLPDHMSIITISMTDTDIDEKEFKDGFLIFYPLILQERFNNGLEITNKTLGNFTIDGHTAGSIIFRNYVDNSRGIINGLFITSVFENNKTFSITYTSSEKNFDRNIKDIESMISSIKIDTK
jgi:hypothetical protein